MRNIIIRIPVGNGDATFVTNRQEYVEQYKKGDYYLHELMQKNEKRSNEKNYKVGK